MERRQLRRRTYNDPGHIHALTFSCFHRFPFLKSDRTCEWLSASINAVRVKFEISILAYVFMPDHVHLVVHPRRSDYNISVILKAIKNPVGRKAVGHLRKHAPCWLERICVKRGERTEHRFWQAGGGYDRNLVEPRALLSTMDYIYCNPVRKQFVTSARDWKWSSAGWFEGLKLNSLKPDPIPTEWLSK